MEWRRESGTEFVTVSLHSSLTRFSKNRTRRTQGRTEKGTDEGDGDIPGAVWGEKRDVIVVGKKRITDPIVHPSTNVYPKQTEKKRGPTRRKNLN
jgi:hypothetical protein